MKENDDRSNAFLGTGQPGSPEQNAALPKFVTDTPGLGATDATSVGRERESTATADPDPAALHR
jgi:hypothetical protein